jgi:hypothetical protein
MQHARSSGGEVHLVRDDKGIAGVPATWPVVCDKVSRMGETVAITDDAVTCSRCLDVLRAAFLNAAMNGK